MWTKKAQEHLYTALGIMTFFEHPDSKREEQLHDAIVVDIKSALARLEECETEE